MELLASKMIKFAICYGFSEGVRERVVLMMSILVRREKKRIFAWECCFKEKGRGKVRISSVICGLSTRKLVPFSFHSPSLRILMSDKHSFL